MTKKNFIALADTLREYESHTGERIPDTLLAYLASFCKCQNPRFNANRWHSYVRGLCGPSGGTIKRKAS